MRILRFALPVILVLFTACGASQSGTGAAGQSVAKADALEIAAAILASQFHIDRGSQQGRVSVFLSLDGKDPPTDFLVAHSTAQTHLIAGSQYAPGKGTHLMIDRLVWTGPDHAKGDIGQVCGPLCGEGFAVVMVRKGTQWHVESIAPTWIS